MSSLLWVKMPSQWVADGVLAEKYSSPDVATDIAALKIYVTLCHNHELSSKITYYDHFPRLLQTNSYVEQLESRMTYDDITERASLSRALVARGISKLAETGLIKVEGTTRKKTYVLVGNPRRSWCKLPRKDLIKNDVISAFRHFTQRYEHERNALKIFLYILAIRKNTQRFVDVSRGVIYKGTHVKLADIDGALGFLKSIGLLDKTESKGYLKSSAGDNLDHEKLHRYWVTGCGSLNLRSVLVESTFD